MVIVSCSGKFHAFALAEQMAKRDLLSIFLTPYAYQKNVRWRELAKRVDKEDIPLEKIKTLIPWAIGSKLLNAPWFWNELFDRWVAKELQGRNDYDVFVGWSGMALQSILVAKAQGKTTIVERGSAHIEVQNELLQAEYAKRGIKYSISARVIKKELAEYAAADYIMVLSQFAWDSFISRGIDAKKMVLNPLGVNQDVFRPLSTPRKAPKLRLVYLGHLSFRKGIPYLLEAIEQLNVLRNDFELLLIGGQTPEITQWFQANPLPKNCQLLGHVPFQQLPELLNTCAIGIIPSIEDGFAQVIPQLLASGVPVITTTNTAGPDMIQNGYNGYIIPIQSSVAIREHLALLMDDPELLAQLQQNAPQSLTTGFSWDDYGQRYADFLQSL